MELMTGLGCGQQKFVASHPSRRELTPSRLASHWPVRICELQRTLSGGTSTEYCTYRRIYRHCHSTSRAKSFRSLHSSQIVPLLLKHLLTFSNLLLDTSYLSFHTSHLRPTHNMSLRQREPPSLKSRLIFSALDRLTRNGREIDRKPMSSYRRRIVADIQQSGSPKASSYQSPPLYPTLPRRQRCLTPPLFDPQELEQTQSPLFILPRELLLLIYEQVLGNNVLHIVRRSNKLGHAPCKINSSGFQDDCKEFNCRGVKFPNGVCVPNGFSRDRIIPLLQTCRKMYDLCSPGTDQYSLI